MSTARLIAITVIIAIITDVPGSVASAQRKCAVNLPMLIKLALVRETSSLERAVIQAQDAGRRYIYVASRVLGAKPDRTGVRQAVRKGRWELRFTH
jgi:hypothetical protein